MKPTLFKVANTAFQNAILVLALGLAVLALSGCASKPRHKATAQEIVAAANTGVIPGWFNAEERDAVAKVRK